MSKKAHETALPKLRFPEFRDAEAWEVKPLGSVAKLIKEKAGSKQYKLMSITSGAGLVSQMEKFGREIAGASYKNYYVIRKGDFAYNKSSTKLDPEGQIALLEKEEAGAVPNSIFTCFRVNEQIVSPHFLKYPFANNLHGKWLRDLITVGARVNGALSIDSKHLLALPLALPSLLEQQKIAATLSSLDALLTAQTAKLTALQDHKRGLMQDLFPAEGETVPKRRFPEFQDAGEWAGSKLGEVSEIVRGGSPRPIEAFITTNPNGLHWLKIGDVPSASKYILQTQQRVIPEALTKTRVVNPGDLILSNSMSFGRPYIAKIKTCIHDGWIAIRKIADWILIDYLYYAILSEPSQSYFLLNAAGAAVLNLNAEIIKLLPVIIPSLAEQQKIADCLSALDTLLTAQIQKIEALKLHKKGLMQALFPAIDSADSADIV